MIKIILRQYLKIFAVTLLWFSHCYSAEDMDIEGKWNKPGIPHRGWTHGGVEDLEEATGECEMCDKKRIRYLHTVTHPDWEDLVVGRDCAEKMCEDYVNPKKRENKAKGEARRRVQEAQIEANRIANVQRSWLDLTNWRKNEKGNYSHRLNGGWINMFKWGIQWKYVFENQFSDPYTTIQEALQASYNQFRQYILLR